MPIYMFDSKQVLRIKKKRQNTFKLFLSHNNVNSEPSGAIAITGTPTENQTLTVNTSNLADSDGLPAANTYSIAGKKALIKLRGFDLRSSIHNL